MLSRLLVLLGLIGSLHFVSFPGQGQAQTTETLVGPGWFLRHTGAVSSTELNNLLTSQSAIHSIWGWSSTSQSWMAKFASATDATNASAVATTLSSLEAGKGYWFRLATTASTALPIATTQPTFALSTSSSWQLLGSQTALSANSAIANLPNFDAANMVSGGTLWAWVNGLWQVYVNGTRPTLFDDLNLGTLTTIPANHGFWVNMGAAGSSQSITAEALCSSTVLPLNANYFSTELAPEISTTTLAPQFSFNFNSYRGATNYRLVYEFTSGQSGGSGFLTRNVNQFTFKYQAGAGFPGTSNETKPTETSRQFLTEYATTGSTWNFRVEALAGTTVLSISTTQSVTVGTFFPARPAALLSLTPGDQSAQVSWCPVLSASGYVVSYGTTTTNIATTIAEVSTTSATISGLTNGTNYYVHVQAKNFNGLGSPSSAVKVTPAASPNLDISIDDVIVAQTVSANLTSGDDANVPLVQDKPGILRVFTQITGNAQDIRTIVRVTAQRIGTTLSPLAKELVVRHAPRSSAEETLAPIFFDLPASWIKPGTSFYVEVDPLSQLTETSKSNNRFPSTGQREFNFVERPTFRLKLVPITTPAGSVTLDATSANSAKNYLLAMYPNANVNVEIGTTAISTTLTMQTTNDWSKILENVNAVRALEVSGTARSIFYYGVLRHKTDQEYAQDPSGLAGLGYTNTDNEISQTIPLTSIGLVFNDTFLSTMAHELGHNQGRNHVDNANETNDTCAQPDGNDTNYPYNLASTNNPEAKKWGRIGKVGYSHLNRELLSQEFYHDIMSYCNRVWISDYTYKAMYDFQTRLAAAFGSSRELQRPGFLVSGQLNQGQWEISSILRLETGGSSGSGPYRLRATTLSGQIIVIEFALGKYDHVAAKWFKIFVPTDESLQRLEIEDRMTGQVLFQQIASAASPSFQGPVFQTQGAGLWSVAPRFSSQRIVRLSSDQGQSWKVLVLDADQTWAEFQAQSGDLAEVQYQQGLNVQHVRETLN